MNIIKFYPFSDKTKSFTPEPIPASRLVPDWYKAQPGSIDDEKFLPHGNVSSTVKRCMPIFDYMTSGYILPMPCDIYIDATNPEKLEWSVPLSLKPFAPDMIASHAYEQYSHYPIDYSRYHKQLFRVMPFWAVGTPEGYSTMFMHPVHKDPLPFLALGGIIDTDKFISDGHLSFLVEKNFKGVIKQGTPFVQVVPFKREPWEMEIVPTEASAPIFKTQRLSVRSTFMNGYKNKFRSKKEFK
jgi:hypothetical protein